MTCIRLPIESARGAASDVSASAVSADIALATSETEVQWTLLKPRHDRRSRWHVPCHTRAALNSFKNASR